NPIGWLFLAEALGFALGVATDNYAKYATRAGVTPPSATWAVWLGAILGELGLLFALALLLFPDGRRSPGLTGSPSSTTRERRSAHCRCPKGRGRISPRSRASSCRTWGPRPACCCATSAPPSSFRQA